MSHSKPVLYRKGLEEINAYVPGKPVEEVRRELGIAGHIIKMASNENPLGPPPGAVEKMREALMEANLYPEGECPELRGTLSHKIGISGEHFIFGNGVDNLIPLVVNTFVNSGDEVILPSPSFAAYKTSTIMAGGVPVTVQLKNFEMDLLAMLGAVTARTKMVFICNPNNPTGTIITKDELETFLAALPSGVVAVIDEAYFEYVENSAYPNSLDYVRKEKNVVVFRTFSKIYGLAGLRVGYGITRPDFVSAMNKIREPFNVNRVAQAGAARALSEDVFIKRARKVNDQGKAIIYEGLKKMGLYFIPSESNFIFADLGVNMKAVFPALLKKGIIVRPGTAWGYPTFARITVGIPEENLAFINALEQVLAELRVE